MSEKGLGAADAAKPESIFVAAIAPASNLLIFICASSWMHDAHEPIEIAAVAACWAAVAYSSALSLLSAARDMRS